MRRRVVITAPDCWRSAQAVHPLQRNRQAPRIRRLASVEGSRLSKSSMSFGRCGANLPLNRWEEKIQERISQDLLVDVHGSKVGQVNGISIIDLGIPVWSTLPISARLSSARA